MELEPDDWWNIFDRLAPFFGAMLESLPDVVGVFSARGRMVYWNRRVNEVTGYRDEDIAAMHPVDFVAEGDRAFVRRQIRDVLAGHVVTFEADLLTRNGRRIPYEYKGSLLEFGDRRLICGAGRDISARRRFEIELGRSERKYRRLFEESQEGIIITTPGGEIVDVNPELCRLSGYSRDELLEMNVIELYTEPQRRRQFAGVMEASGACRGFEMRARRKDGAIVTCQVSASARRDSDGRAKVYQSFIRDITAQKRAQAALEESEEKFRILAEKALVGIQLVQDGVFRYANPALEEMFGYDSGDLAGRSPREVIHPDDWPRVSSRVEELIAGRRDSAHYKCRGIRNDGGVRTLEMYGSRITYQEDRAVIGSVMDITERQCLQREVLRVQEKERHRLAHDLHDVVGSHLSGTRMALQTLASRAETDYPELAKDLQEITELVKKSSIDARRLSEELSPVQLKGVGLRTALEQVLRMIATEPETTCRLEVEGTMPEFPDEAATHFYWIAREAVTNARKHAQPSTIHVKLQVEEQACVLAVTDDGSGFDPEAQRHMRMGLRTMQYRAELLGGVLTLESTPGEGTCVRCRLPIGALE